jgi:uncharacterized metal-binding protein
VRDRAHKNKEVEMMAKKQDALYWAVISRYGYTAFEIMKVTSEAGRNNRRIYGSSGGESTNALAQHIVCKVENEDAAKAALSRALAVRVKYTPRLEQARRELRALEHEAREAELAAVKESALK